VQGSNVSGPQHAKVAAVEGCELWLSEAFGNRQNSSINQADLGVW
jgi:hypothetical protein